MSEHLKIQPSHLCGFCGFFW